MTKHSENTEQSNSTKPVLCNGFRIGNYFKELGDDFHYHEVLGVQGNVISFDDFYNDTEYSEYNVIEIPAVRPIKITTKWLEKLGFKFIIRNMWELKIDFYTTLQFYDNQNDYITLHIKNYKDMKFESETYTYLKHIKHIHEVQNLFHSLTGRELTVA